MLKHRKVDARYPESYNGWTNQETWTVYNWLTVETDIYDTVIEVAENGPDALKEFVYEEFVPVETTLVSDLLTTSLAWLNWEELVEALTEK